MDYVVQAAHFIAAQIEGDVRKARILDGPDDFLPMGQDRRDFIDGDFDAGYIAVIADAQGALDVRRYGGFGRIDLSQAVRRQFTPYGTRLARQAALCLFQVRRPNSFDKARISALARPASIIGLRTASDNSCRAFIPGR